MGVEIAWDLRTDEAKALISRADYLRLNSECKKMTGFSSAIQKITISSDTAEVRAISAGVGVTYSFIYEHGQWLYDPPADVKAKYALGVDKLISQEQAAGNCS